MKVQDLAKSLGKSTKDLIKFLEDFDIKVKSGATRLDDETVTQIKDLFEGEVQANKLEVSADDNGQGTLTKEVILTGDTIGISELATRMNTSISEILRETLQMGMLLNLNSQIEIETAEAIATRLGYVVRGEDVSKKKSLRDHISKIEEQEMDENLDTLETRPPVITIMGHVDHGKTCLLDTIRESNVVAGEAGGITQHIGAYQVEVNGRKLTFLDTPGHEAFTALRARGAQVTDIVILVVAADEGVKPQTVEAIHHAKSAGVPIIVAINKMDKPGANPDHVKQELSQHDLLAEEWGGKTIMVPISAKKKQGIQQLLEMVLLTADILELKASSQGRPKAVVIESRLSRKKGPIATVLVKTGALRVGDSFVIDSMVGKVRALFNDHAESVVQAVPGTPVEVLGISDVPRPGSILEVTENEREARQIAETFRLQDQAQKQHHRVSLESLSHQIDQSENRVLNLIIKADVNGSLEAIISSINQIPTKDVRINIIHSATGPVTENDINLALASSAIIITFNVKSHPVAERLADEEGIEIKSYSIIYNIIDDLTKAVEGMFKVEYEEVSTGKIEVRQLFRFSKVGIIAGCYVLEGKVKRNQRARILRGGKEIYEGVVASLKRFKDDVKEVATGFECGIVMDNFVGFEEGDIVIPYELREKK